MKQLKTGLFGGTFDPVHIGHLINAQRVKEIRELDRIIFIPAFISPFKTGEKRSEASDRMAMLKTAISGIDGFDISDYEITKGDVSYTVDTLHHFREEYDNLELIVGFDNLAAFDKWHQPDDVLELAQLVVMKRITDDKEFDHDYDQQAVIVDTPVIEISSTEIRKRVQQGLDIRYMVPESVRTYIEKNKLYKT